MELGQLEGLDNEIGTALRTEMVHDVRLAPLGAIRPRLLSTVANSSIQQQVVDLALAQLGQRLLRKRLDALEIRQVQRQHGHAADSTVELQAIVRSLSARRVASAKDDFIRLRLLEQLLNGFEALAH